MPSNERWLLREATVAGRRLDCRIRDGRVAELAPALTGADGEATIDARGGELLPGLADHHIHLRALAAAGRSVDLRGAGIADAPSDDAPGWLRIIGAGDELTRGELDAIWPDRPVRVQHRSGALWTLNSAALAQLGPGATAEELTTGQFWRAGDRLRAMLHLDEQVDLTAVSALLSSYGITHVTDATPDADPATLTVDQHVLSLAADGTGPRKVIVADHRLPTLEELVHAIRDAHAAGRGVALHVVSAVAMALALAALDIAGSDGADRIEHAAVCDDDGASRLAALGVTVVTQPSIVARHGSRFLQDSDPPERDLLWRYGGLLRHGVRVAASSDAPYGDCCPWTTIAAAARRDCGGVTIGDPGEQVAPATVLASMLTEPADPAGAPRTIALGRCADLCLLDADLDTALDRALRGETQLVRATFIAGRLRYRR
jgi:predicted amidohydrolase YtcJ